MEPTLIFDSGYVSRLPSGDVELTPERRTTERDPLDTDGRRLEFGGFIIHKSDAVKLARFILEGVE